MWNEGIGTAESGPEPRAGKRKNGNWTSAASDDIDVLKGALDEIRSEASARERMYKQEISELRKDLRQSRQDTEKERKEAKVQQWLSWLVNFLLVAATVSLAIISYKQAVIFDQQSRILGEQGNFDKVNRGVELILSFNSIWTTEFTPSMRVATDRYLFQSSLWPESTRDRTFYLLASGDAINNPKLIRGDTNLMRLISASLPDRGSLESTEGKATDNQVVAAANLYRNEIISCLNLMQNMQDILDLSRQRDPETQALLESEYQGKNYSLTRGLEGFIQEYRRLNPRKGTYVAWKTLTNDLNLP